MWLYLDPSPESHHVMDPFVCSFSAFFQLSGFSEFLGVDLKSFSGVQFDPTHLED
jgi:hypothetical protein